jgi:hypothetical protein
MEDAIRLCHETASYVYGEYTPLVAGYRPGSRPELEPQAARAIAGCRNPDEVVRGIACSTAGLGRGLADEDLATSSGGRASPRPTLLPEIPSLGQLPHP